MKTSATTLATLALAAALVALAPGRTAADPAAIFVGNLNGNNGNGNVPAYSTTGAAATGYAAPSVKGPEGIAYNPANNTLYVVDRATNQIRTFDSTTGAETQIGFATAPGLVNPYGLALNAGVLYVGKSNAGMSYNDRILAYDAATGAQLAGFTSPTGLYSPTGLAVSGTTLFVANSGDGTLRAYNLATGTAAAGFTTITGLSAPGGVALYGNDLFVANNASNTVGEYDATTGLAINTAFLMNLDGPEGLAVLGNRLLVTNVRDTTVGAYGIPTLATAGNGPTSSTPAFLTGLSNPEFIAVGNVPEPGTWALLGVGAAGLGVVRLRRRRAVCVA